jgi:rhodanese-related sulfurtransferase
VVVCADGNRSGELADDLRERGFEAATIKRGMKGWTQKGLPTLPREAEEYKGPG